ncbi:MAG: hypothetical protein ACFFDK_02870 [Promethearchaeota archaeon]
MTNVTEKEFEVKLLDVVRKLTSIANNQGARFKTKWNEYLKPINDKPHLVRQIKLDKEKFIDDINYRIAILKDMDNAFADGFYTIKSLLDTLYNSYFNDSALFKKDFSKEDQLMLKYYIAREILGNLVQYNQMDHETVPLKYNVIARNYLLIKLKGQMDSEILENLSKLKIEIDIADLHNLMEEIEVEGIITKTKKGENYFYELKKELKLSDIGKEKYNKNLRPLVEWPTQFWRSFYNIRELNVTVEDNVPNRDFLHKILSRTATQGFSAADYVFKNLIKYYEETKKN